MKKTKKENSLGFVKYILIAWAILMIYVFTIVVPYAFEKSIFEGIIAFIGWLSLASGAVFVAKPSGRYK